MVIEELFEASAQRLLANPNVTRAKMFGAPTLKVSGKVFACLFKGKLVLKLPQQRVAVIVGSGQGERFDPGMGRVMKEWVSLEPLAEQELEDLVAEALDFVASAR